ncbi:MAG TPA: hypothetical protein VMV01_02585, partial [Planctomycetota bacterium]|nr:hypothetical protein [Planctomycetota bacterium]
LAGPAPGFLFHAAFCGSTVLARALHDPPRAVALKEPRALMLLSHATLGLEPGAMGAIRSTVAAGVRLLARPWSEGGRVLIKPTNAVNRIMPLLLGAAPEGRALLLHGDLEAFLYSCCRKLPEAETRLRWMAQHLLAGTALAERLDIPPGFQPNFIEACVLTWAATIEQYADALARDETDRLRSLAREALDADPVRAVGACAEWLGLDAAPDGLRARVAGVFGRDAKHADRDYDAAARGRQQREMESAHGGVVRDALRWSERIVLPALARSPGWKPLPL